MSGAQRVVVLGVVLLIGIFGGGLVIYAFPTASNQWYAPTQPIPFSHRLHAGDKKIDCRYCHIGVGKSKHHTIPSLNTCMNCHKVVKPDSPHIQKLTEAYNSGKPIEWIRVHELPDFVVFNHRPHIDVGLECATCHGDVKNMEKIHQEKPLTMGWCLECHRGVTTPPHISKKMHPGVEDPSGLPVAPIDCSTCHY